MESAQSQSAPRHHMVHPSVDNDYVRVSRQATRVGLQVGNYRLVHLLAEGGFAEVYLGQHIHLNTYAAIKILQAQITKEEMDAFREEARMVASLRHPHIVSILDFDVEQGMPFLVMEHAPNGTLRQRHPKGTVIAPHTVLPYITQIAEALEYAHQQQLIHRDVKQENMLIGCHGEVLLSDFGIAVMAQATRTTLNKEVIGTVAYMSPEQLRGKAVPASDQYSLAVVVYEWLCGQCPFQGPANEVVSQHLTATPASLCERNRQLSSTLEQVVFKALEKEPERRYENIYDFVQAFAAASPQHALLLRRSSALVKDTEDIPPSLEKYEAETVHVLADTEKKIASSHRISRRALLAGMLGTVASIAVAGGALLIVQARPYRPPAPTVEVKPTPTATQVPHGTLSLIYRGHTEAVQTLAWSPSPGVYMASAGSDRSLRIWQANTGVDMHICAGHSDRIQAVAWSPDAQYIASACRDKTARVWVALRQDEEGVVYRGHREAVNALSWSSGERYVATFYIASASDDKTVRIWKAQTGDEITVYKYHRAPVYTVGWSPLVSRYIASAGADKEVHVWDATDSRKRPLVVYQGHTDEVKSLAWSPDGQYIVSAGKDKTIQIWNAMIGASALITCTGHTATVNAVCWSPDGGRIASASDDGTVRVWDAKDGSQIFVYTGHGNNGAARVYSTMWSSDGSLIASAGQDKAVHIWSI